jgi:membrane protease YdiL (CAAX protease family)
MERNYTLKQKLIPIIKMSGLLMLVALIIIIIYALMSSLPSFMNVMRDSSWIFADLVHVPQFVVPFVLICFITKGRLGEYGFNLRQKPPLFTHIRMFGLGAFFGLLMSLKYISQAVENTPIDIPQPVTLANVIGNMTFQWIVVGLSEETLFRGLIQTYLMDNLKGYIKLFGHNLHIGTIVGAILWGLFHFINILVMPLGAVVSFVILTTIAGLGMGYAYQETRSIFTTIIVHNSLFGVPLTIGYILYWLL